MQLVLDFETKDPFIQRGLGGGWAYAMDGADSFKVLGAAYQIDDHDPVYETDMTALKNVIRNVDSLIMHNAMYDYGIMQYLWPDLDYDKFMIYDTKIMAKVLHSNMFSYTLKNLAKHFKVSQKSDQALFDQFYELGLFSKVKSERTGKNFTSRPNDVELKNCTYANLDLMPDDIVGDYAKDDIRATYEIFNKMKDDYDGLDGFINGKTISDLLKVCIDMRKTGIRVDLERTRQVSKLLHHKYNAAAIPLYHKVGKFNINSPVECAEVLKAQGLVLPQTEQGKDSVTKFWLVKQDNPICKDIVRVRKYDKIKRDFIDKILDIQEMMGFTGKYGKVYSELHPFGASTTGRFSSSGINIQQIPRRDRELGSLIRSIFVPDKGEKWASADFSNQEQRLQVHYAATIGCKGGADLCRMWSDDPNLDFHGKVAEMAGISRDEAKTINLGLSYGMGPGKLCRSLGYSTTEAEFVNDEGKLIKWEKPGPRGQKLLNSYHTMFPYLKEMKMACENQMKVSKYIKTIGGRKLKSKGMYDWRNGLNWLIQGSAADQTILAILKAKEYNLKILSVVHDEINISYKDEKDVENLRKAMEDCLNLKLPTVADVKVGRHWGDCKD